MKKLNIILYVFFLIVLSSFILSGSGLGYQGINITIFSPVNNSVHYTTFIDLNWTVNLTSNNVSWCAYSLDGGANNTDIFEDILIIEDFENVSDWSVEEDVGSVTLDSSKKVTGNYSGNITLNANGAGTGAAITQPSPALDLSSYARISFAIWVDEDDWVTNNIFKFRIRSSGSACLTNTITKSELNDDSWTRFYFNLSDASDWGSFLCDSSSIDYISFDFLDTDSNTPPYDVWVDDLIATDGGENATLNITLTSLSVGTHNATIYCNDTSGNMGQSYYTRWYNGNYTVSAPEGQSLDTSVLTLNISKDDDFISNINVTFTYNNTLQTLVSNTSYTNYIIFNKTITNPDIDSDTNVPYFWNVTINQSDGISYDFIISENQSVLPWGLDNCTLYSTHAINFSFKDETNSSTVTSDITGTFIYSTDQITYKTFNLDLDQVENFSICIKPPGTTIFSSYELKYSATGYPSRRYNENNGVLTNATVLLPLYLLQLSDGIYGRFKVVDQYQVPLDDVTISMKRTISGTERVIEQETTDSSGLATFWVDPDENHDFTFTKTGYESGEFTLRLTTSEIYTITLTSQVTDENESISIGLWYRFSPINTILNNNTNYNFSFTLNSSYNDITNCTLRLKNGSEILSQSSSSFTTSSCGITIEYSTGNFTSILSEAIFEINHTSITVSQQYSVIYTYQGEFSLMSFFDDLSDFAMAGFNDFTRMIIALIVIFIITVLAAQNLGFTDTEKLIPLVVMLVWFFSYVNWFYLNFAPIPTIAGFDLKKYIIAILITLTGIAFLMEKFTR